MRAVFVLTASETDSQLLQHACHWLQTEYQQQQRVFVLTAHESQAHALDELLWTFSENSFIPHKLAEETLSPMPPIVLGSALPSQTGYDCLLNLSQQLPTPLPRIPRIVELISGDPEKKAHARERYRYYKAQGWELQTVPQPTSR